MDRWTYLQGRNRDRDVENSLTDTAGGEQVGLGEWHWGMRILGRRTDSQWEAVGYHRGSTLLCDSWEGWDGVVEGGSRVKGRVCTYGDPRCWWQNLHNTARQLSSN